MFSADRLLLVYSAPLHHSYLRELVALAVATMRTMLYVMHKCHKSEHIKTFISNVRSCQPRITLNGICMVNVCYTNLLLLVDAALTCRGEQEWSQCQSQ